MRSMLGSSPTDMPGVGDCMPDSMAFDIGSVVVHSSNIQRFFSEHRKSYVAFSHYFAVTAA